MKVSQIALALSVALSANAYAIVNGTEVDTSSDPHQEVVKIIDSKYGNCTGTLIAHKWVITADHCIGGGQSGYLDLALESWGTIDKSYDNTKMNKDEYFNQMQVGVRNGRPEIKGGWQTFSVERAVSFRVIPESFESCADTLYSPTDQYVNDDRCTTKNNATNYDLDIVSDVGLVRLTEAQSINATGYIADIESLPATPTERTGYLTFSDGSLMDVEVFAYAPVKSQDFLETPLMVANGGVSYPIFTDGGSNILNNTSGGVSIPYYAGSASTIRFDNKDGQPVYAQGGNSGAGVRLINPQTNDYDIFGVLSSQFSPLSMSEALNKNALTQGMSEVIGQTDVDQAAGDNAYWEQLEFTAEAMARTTNAALPSAIGSLQYDAFTQTLLNEVYALNSPKQITVSSSKPEQVRVQNLSLETLDMKTILTAKDSNGILVTNYETVGVNTLSSDCSSVKPLQSCLITVEVQDDTVKGSINMAFTGSKQPDQELLVNENVQQGNWLDDIGDGSDGTDGGDGADGGTDGGDGNNGNTGNNGSSDGSSSGGSMGLFSLLGLLWVTRKRYLETK